LKCIIMANGEYGDLHYYDKEFLDADIVLCADGGANYALKMGIIPSYIIGDMDSINQEVKEYFAAHNVLTKTYSEHKDFTDLQLVLLLAEQLGAKEIVLLGSLGNRLDHTLSNIYAGIDLIKKGIKIMHYHPLYDVYLINWELELVGNKGDIVSVLPLTDMAKGVWEKGFEYPLSDVILTKSNPYSISNVLTQDKGEISVREGILCVIHYKCPSF